MIMSVFYQLSYRIGFHPWEDLADHPPFAAKLAELLDREERGQVAPFGRALDVGTGSGIWSVQLARRGWQVTAIDNVEPALRRARKRAEQEGADMRIVRADVTTLSEAQVGSGFQLVLDTGTFHGLDSAERAAMGRSVNALTTRDATVLLDVFAPGRRGPLPRGATRADVEAAFPGWKITDVEVADSEPDPLAQRLKFDEHWYRLRRE
jgi:cyclopropane fatty-acyl-phospholipid synthase-like methyltransferase